MWCVAAPLLLPERGARFQIIHEKFSRLKGVHPMPRGSGDHHDLVARAHQAIAVDHQCARKGPARLRFLGNLGQRLFRHARVMLDHHLVEIAAIIAHNSREADNSTRPGLDIRESIELLSGCKDSFLNADVGHLSAACHGREKRHFAHPVEAGIEIAQVLIKCDAQGGDVGKSHRIAFFAAAQFFYQIGDGFGVCFNAILWVADPFTQPGKV